MGMLLWLSLFMIVGKGGTASPDLNANGGDTLIGFSFGGRNAKLLHIWKRDQLIGDSVDERFLKVEVGGERDLRDGADDLIVIEHIMQVV